MKIAIVVLFVMVISLFIKISMVESTIYTHEITINRNIADLAGAVENNTSSIVHHTNAINNLSDAIMRIVGIK